MNAWTPSRADAAPVAARSFTCTFGHYRQLARWTDRRDVSWADLTRLLTVHRTGAKEGDCIVPAVFRGERRHKADADRIGVAFLDSDAGAPLSEITAAIKRQGWAAIVSSTHSHLTTQSRVRSTHWQKFLTDGGRDAASFLLDVKGYRPEIAVDARVTELANDFAVIVHQPCPKFRIAVPLLQPWRAADYSDQDQANAAWKERVEALAATLGLTHDQACTDTSRLFYLPRRPTDGARPETALIDGTFCDLFALPAAPGVARQHGAPESADAGNGFTFCDPETGQVVDLRAWARHHAGRFEIVAALQARRPGIFVGKVAESIKHHLRCPNEDEHTEPGADAATFMVNASQSSSKGFVYHCRHAHCEARDRLYFLKRMLEQRWLAVVDLTDARFLNSVTPSVRPIIRYVAGELPRVVDEAERTLLAAQLGIYQRGGAIVRPGRSQITSGQPDNEAAQRICEVGDYAMVEAMTLAAEWEKFDGRSESWVRINAPKQVAATYRERSGRWQLPPLVGIINAPTLRPDGTLLDTPGYDLLTGLLFEPAGLRLPSIPEQPDWASADAALQVLRDLVATFPFVGSADRSVVLSALLTACIRRSLPTAPMHAFTAPTPGSGKSMLVDLASVLATGREAGVLSQSRSEEELEKRLGALLLAGEQVVAIDNCEAPLGGEFLCSMLTQRVVRPRILGRSEVPELPANVFVTATGNNLTLLGDMTRRALLCRLDPKHERPELRRFANDPVATVKADRGRYLVAALTVLRAYHLAGRPALSLPLGSFTAWSGWVRGALLWLGEADPVETMEGARELDPHLDALVAVLTQWHATLGADGVSVRDIIAHATQQHTPLSATSLYPARMEFMHPDFREALLAVAGEGGAINGKRLGKWLSGNKDRIVEGLRIVRGTLSAGVQRWRVDVAG